MKFFIVCAIVSVVGFLPAMFFALNIIRNETLGFLVVMSSILTLVYSIVAMIAISVKKKDCQNAPDIKAFKKKAISIFLIIFAYILLFGLANVLSSRSAVLAFLILVLILLSLISIPFVIHNRYRSQEKKAEASILEQLANNYSEDDK